jgi:hypothetical protein
MSRGAIKIPYARRHGALVHISAVESGLHRNCLCVACHQPLVARKPKSGRTAHFAHHAAADCNAETALHMLGKELLMERVRSAINARRDVPIRWHCLHCGEDHSGNLIKRAARVEVEHDLGGRTPDLVLFDQAGQPCAVIEIVVTHEPEPGARRFYRERRIPMVEFQLGSGADLDLLAQEVLRPRAVTHCPVPAWKNRIVVLAGTVLKLGEVETELEGARLSFQTRGDDNTGGYFLFDTPAQAERALERLKEGSLDGLYEPEWLQGAVVEEGVKAYRQEFARLGLKEFGWGFAGIRRTTWKRGQSRRGRRW